MRIIIWLLLLYIGYRVVRHLMRPAAGSQGEPKEKDSSAETTFRDPVCGIYVSEDNAVIGRLDDQRHYFCSHQCLERFRDSLEHTTNGRTK